MGAGMKLSPKLEEHRLLTGVYGSRPGATYGVFNLPGPCGERLRIIASDGEDTGWEHVSVSTERGKRIPNWQEMCFVKDLFWAPEECVVQFHPPASQYVNNYSVVLHLWRCTQQDFPMPPAILVGDKELGTLA
jgi:hypothetical protein